MCFLGVVSLLLFDSNTPAHTSTTHTPHTTHDTRNRHYNSNVHRGVHYLSAKATTAYEDARAKVARFIGAASDREVVFTRNASEAINLVAQTWGMDNLKEGDEVGVSGGGCVGVFVDWTSSMQGRL